MDAWAKALQPVSDPNFIDHAFKEDPRGVTFRQWQPIEPMLDSYGRQLETEDANNHGGSSQGSQTAMEPYFRRIFSTGIFRRVCFKLWLAVGHLLQKLSRNSTQTRSLLQDTATLTEQATTMVPVVTRKT